MRPFSNRILAVWAGILIVMAPSIAICQDRLDRHQAFQALARELPWNKNDKVALALASSRILNYPCSQISLSDFQGKLIILDFWASWCSNCTGAFSKLDSLQRQFPNQLQILLVNSASTQDSPEKIKAVIARWEQQHGRKFILPVIYQDTLLDKTFPHRLLPHYVWINDQGSVKATTTSESITAANIRAILDHKPIRLPVKQDQLHIDLRKPLLLTEQVSSTAHSFRSVMTGNIPGMGSWAGVHREPQGNYINRVYATNLSILSLYELSYRGQLPFPFRNRLILSVKDSSKFDFPQEMAQQAYWSRHNTFSYELAVPAAMSDNIFEIMRKNLNEYFKCEARVEKRPMLCLILSRRKKHPTLVSAGGKEQVSFLDTTIIRNRPLKALTDALARNRHAPPVLDETGYTGNVDLVLNASITELPKLKQELHKYGLDLITAMRNIDMIVISEKTR